MYTITVSNNKYNVNGLSPYYLYSQLDTFYLFDQTDTSNTGHAIKFGTDADTTDYYTTGVTTFGDYTRLVIAPDFSGSLFYFSSSTASMGNAVIHVYNNEVLEETQIFKITVANNNFYVNNVESPELNVIENTSYFFDQSDSSNIGYPLVFGTTEDSTPYYTNNITTYSNGLYTVVDVSGWSETYLYYFSNIANNMGNRLYYSEPVYVDTSEWIGTKSVHDSSLTIANFLTYINDQGVVTTSYNVDADNTNNSYSYGDKVLIFFKGHSGSGYLEFTAPFTSSCEIKYANQFAETRLYLNDFTDANWIHRNTSQKTPSTHVFNVTVGDKIRLMEYGSSVSYLYYINFV